MSNPDFDLTGQTALITGAGRGIGLATARTLARAGADIIIAEYNRENGENAAAEIERLGRRSIFIEVDVRRPESVDQMAATALAAIPQIDILVSNAGIAEAVAAEECSDDQWLNMIATNLNGVFWTCRAVGRHMLERRSGVIVNVASMSGMIVNTPQPQAHYNASKAAVILLTKSLASEWVDRGIRVNCVSPGYIGTEMTAPALTVEEWNSAWHRMTPMNRLGKPEEIANAIHYLASPASSFCTGTNLVADGGYTSW